MLRNTFFALCTLLAAAASSQAAIILEQSAPTPLSGGLVSYTISAVGTEGEVINTFSNPTIQAAVGGLGVHSVRQAFTTAVTPTVGQHTAGLWNAEWEDYDTYFFFDGPAQLALSLGAPLNETIDDSTTGTLGLAAVPAAPSSGFGAFTSGADSSKVLVPALAGSNIPFMQVVMRANDFADLGIRVLGDGGNAIGDWTTDPFRVGPGTVIPEPTTIALLGLAMVGFVGLRRRS